MREGRRSSTSLLARLGLQRLSSATVRSERVGAEDEERHYSTRQAFRVDVKISGGRRKRGAVQRANGGVCARHDKSRWRFRWRYTVRLHLRVSTFCVTRRRVSSVAMGSLPHEVARGRRTRPPRRDSGACGSVTVGCFRVGRGTLRGGVDRAYETRERTRYEDALRGRTRHDYKDV